MANTRSGNTYYIDTEYATNEELAATGKSLKVVAVIVTATAARGRLVLTDSGTSKLDLRVATSGETKHFPIDSVFKTSIRPTTLSNAVATVILGE